MSIQRIPAPQPNFGASPTQGAYAPPVAKPDTIAFQGKSKKAKLGITIAGVMLGVVGVVALITMAGRKGITKHGEQIVRELAELLPKDTAEKLESSFAYSKGGLFIRLKGLPDKDSKRISIPSKILLNEEERKTYVRFLARHFGEK